MTPGRRVDSESKQFNVSCRKSNYNLGLCDGCGKPIFRGDLITQCCEQKGMTLRYRTHKDGSFYTPSTCSRFVHLNCQISEDGSYYWTDWAADQHSKTYNNMTEEDYLANGWIRYDDDTKAIFKQPVNKTNWDKFKIFMEKHDLVFETTYWTINILCLVLICMLFQ